MRLPAATMLILLLGHTAAAATELSVRVQNLPPAGTLVLQIYDDPDAFGDLRNPAREVRYPIQADQAYVIPDAPAGTIAVVAYVDENANRALDRNFIGIPREPLALSNNYQPKGPPSFQQASFVLEPDEAIELTLDLYRVLGESGLWGVGLGVIGRSSPYVGSDTNVIQPIPAITYLGERLQWLGPNLRFGLLGSDDLRLAATASYRVGVYEEDDSDFLAGLGDRKSTLMAGLGVIYDGPYGVEFGLTYEHDVLDRIGGGTTTARASRGFQFGNLRLTPQFGVNWLSRDLANHDFGVPAEAANAGRPAYDVGSTMTVQVGLGGFYEITESWQIVLNLAVERLGSDIADSPIVGDDRVIQGFGAVTYAF